ncbi:hypothetical protein [Streptomyces fulvorobeus]|uniref:Uncharacterized protein n=1 Tax=Streptomyces fulvorobeus TaxID=284028 RepID=A0A7J0CGM9_9ACTN|nr:hypothetical protein [Streptomyces fulvorobeus]NYE44843.1 hypothetical protein [Streptomyces fulvorobeus]GFN01438.1 hypothetical protein Sfulv_62480 [Streptomyces fulvorobeus]
MYGQMRVLLVDRIAGAVASAARVAGLAVRLATATRMGPTDLYAALATARFMAAHELIEKTADAVRNDDPEADVVHLSQPAWFGGNTIFEEK